MSKGLKPSPLTLPVMRQWGLVGGVGALAVILFLVAPSIHQVESSPPVAIDPNSSDLFRANDAQWSTLKTGVVQQMVFFSTEQTDGKIATDDDITTPVFSQYSGRVVRVFAKAGDVVAMGAALLEVEASEFVQGQNDLVIAKAKVISTEAQLRMSTATEKRQHELFDAKGTSYREWQQSQADLAEVSGELRSAEIALVAARGRLKILGKSDAEIGRLEASAGPQQTNPVATVHAPISGTIIQRQVGVGQYINSAAGAGTPIFSIGDLSKVWLVAKVREADAPAIKIGQPVEVRVLAFPGKVFHAQVTYVSPGIDPDTRRLTVRAEISNPDGLLRPEMFASFRITTGDEALSAAIPEDAVIFEGEKAHVWFSSGGEKAHMLQLREVTLGRRNGGFIEITGGLQPGDTIITGGALFIDRAAKND